MTYEKLLENYRRQNPTADVSTPQGQQAFNDWTLQVAQQTGADSWEGIPDNTFGNPFAADSLASAIDTSLLSGAQRAGEGGNTNQVQGGFQSGSFGTTGQTQQSGTNEQSAVTNQTGVTNTSGTTNQTGTSTQQGQTKTSTDQTATSTGTRKVDDTLGFGRLLQSQQGAAASNDANRNAFLTDLVNTGGKQFQDQVNFSANRALSGPGMVGVGDGARGRVAGAAVGDVARNNLSQRLEASGQLAGPTAVGRLAEQGAAYNGETTTGTTRTTGTSVADTTGTTNFNQTGTNTGVSNTNNTTNSSSLGLTNLLGTEMNQGTSNASSAQVATGQVPEGKTTSGGGGGCGASIVFVHLDQLTPSMVRHAIEGKASVIHNYATSIYGYLMYGPLIARCLVWSALFAACMYPIVRGILYEEIRLGNPTKHKKKLFASFWHAVFTGVSWPIGYVALKLKITWPLRDKFMINLYNKYSLNYFDAIKNKYPQLFN